MLTTATSESLLEGLKNPGNRTVWQAYVERYRPLLVRYAGRRGVPEEEVEDLAQIVLLEFSEAYRAGKYDPAKGRLRSWLFGIATNQIRNWARRRGGREGRPPPERLDTDAVANLPDREDSDGIWEQEWRDAVLRQCFEEVRREVEPRTFEAFELFALREWPAERVAEKLGTTANAVFLAKRRILRRARELLPLVEEIW